MTRNDRHRQRQQQLQHTWLRVLREAVLRNGRVTISKSYDGDEADAPPRLPSRLLALSSDGTILIQRPHRPGSAKLCQEGARLDLFLPDGTQWWAGRCTVQGTLRYPLNQKQVVHAVRLGSAKSIWSAQRRSFFRVDAAGSGLESVHVIPTDTSADEAPLPIGDIDKAHGHDRFEAMLHDVSGSGMGLRLDARSHLGRWLKPGTSLRCIFRLPDEPRPLDVPAVLTRIQKISGGLLHLGIAFNFDEPHQRRQIEDRLARFTTSLQRRQIQRLRGA